MTRLWIEKLHKHALHLTSTRMPPPLPPVLWLNGSYLVDGDGDDEVKDEEAAHKHEDDKEDAAPNPVVEDGLRVLARSVGSQVHDLRDARKGRRGRVG